MTVSDDVLKATFADKLNKVLQTHHFELRQLFDDILLERSNQNGCIIDPVVPDEKKKWSSAMALATDSSRVTKSVTPTPNSIGCSSIHCDVAENKLEVTWTSSTETGTDGQHSPETLSRSPSKLRLSLSRSVSFGSFIPSWKTARSTRWGEFQFSVWNFFEDPEGGLANQLFHVVSYLLIAVSVTSAVMSTANISDNAKAALHIADICFTTLFTVELLVKIICYPDRLGFLKSLYTLIDFAVVVAGLLGIFLADVKSIWLDLISTQVPILRLLKITRHSSGWRLLIRAIKHSLIPLLVPLYLMLLMIVFTGSLHFWIDNVLACTSSDCPESEKPAFASIPHAMWFVLVSLSTVGYGDITPHTDLGKILACCQIVMGLCYMAMPLAIIGNSFSEVWQDRHRILLRDKLSYGAVKRDIKDVRRLFYTFDDDKSGTISLDEFIPFVESLEMGLSKRVIHDLFKSIDLDGSGIISFEEFAEVVFPESKSEESETS